MLELGVGADLLRGVGFFVWVLFGVALLLALIKPKAIASKVLWSLLVIALFFGPMMPRAYDNYVFKQRYAKAKALFDERCRTAGEKIYRTVENVESILLKSTRGKHQVSNYVKQDWDGAGFPGESSGNQYIFEFVYYNKPSIGLMGRSLGAKPGGIRGYRFVEVEEADGRYRYTVGDPMQFGPPSAPDKVAGFGSRELSKAPAPQYVVSYENIADPEGRAFWIAGGHVKVVDQRSGEVLGEFIRYAFERGFGNSSGERSAWAFATQCPLSSYGGASGHIRSFVEQVLKPIQGE